MNILNTIISKVMPWVVKPDAAKAAPTTAATTATQNAARPASPSAPQTQSTSAQATPTQHVDVEEVLRGIEERGAKNLDWRHSIVDLMKMLDLDSDIASRRQLAKELNYTGDMGDSATMNIWLHKQVMRKLEENGGKIPDAMKH